MFLNELSIFVENLAASFCFDQLQLVKMLVVAPTPVPAQAQ